MRILSKALKLFSIAVSLCATPLWAQGAPTVLQSLLNAEVNFARMAAEKGTRDAFLANLADDAVIFEPGPVNGKQSWLKREPSQSTLSWQPIFADVARADDLGYTTGPWEFRKNSSDTKATAYGQFVSVWKKQPDGTWKVVADIGTENSAPLGNLSIEEIEHESLGNATIDVKSARRALASAERKFSDASASDTVGALIAAASDNIRVFRNGRFPAIGKEAAQLMLSYDHGRMTAKELGSGISRSGDLAYYYGEYSTKRLDGIERGSFIMIWKTTSGDDWKLVVDLRTGNQEPEKGKKLEE